jgi:hypothetical protein
MTDATGNNPFGWTDAQGARYLALVAELGELVHLTPTGQVVATEAFASLLWTLDFPIKTGTSVRFVLEIADGTCTGFCWTDLFGQVLFLRAPENPHDRPAPPAGPG